MNDCAERRVAMRATLPSMSSGKAGFTSELFGAEARLAFPRQELRDTFRNRLDFSSDAAMAKRWCVV
ncbi:MAG TPA: hypothetical protein VOA41_17350 [Candidatus Dormibacteraeota bacterium]|nr:hypothetical protein [Candidatus Dormibacteraeota bacterium]